MTSFKQIEIAFLVHTSEMFNHYSPVWDKLNRNEFLIIIHCTAFESEKILDLCNQYQVNCVFLGDVLASGHRFPYLVSNHAIHGDPLCPLIKVIGIYNIRFMYALGKGNHNLSDWNQFYDLFLCFGPYHQHTLAQFGKPCVQMGYPRYDIVFNENVDLSVFRQQLKLDPSKETLLWLPTWKELSSVPLFADMMATLMDSYNIIVKLHPLSLEEEPEVVAKLMNLPFTAVISAVVDNVFLYLLADKVICDYGGTAFGAIYLDKPLLLLNLPDAESDPLAGEMSPDIVLRDNIVNLDLHSFHRIHDMLNNQLIWSQQKQTRKQLRERYFATHYGFSAEVAAQAIRHAGDIIAMQG